MKKVVYLFPTNRQKLLEEVEYGIAPDNNLYGLNHLQKFFQVDTFDGAQVSLNVNPKQTPVVRQESRWVGQEKINVKLERVLNLLFLPLVWFFNSRYTKLNLGRVILVLPRLWRADAVITCVDSINKAVAILKKLNLFFAPLICMEGNVMDETEKFPRLHQWLWSGVDQIITHAPVDQEKLVRLGLGDRGVTIPVGSDGDFWHTSGLPRRYAPRNDGQTLVVSVGADRDRDYQTLFLAASQLKQLKFLVCCGQKSVESLEIPENVEVRINVSALETREILSKAGMVVLPLQETFRASGQLALLDAMLMEKPMIVSKTRGVVEAYGLVNMNQVVLVPPGDVKSLAQAIEQLKSNKNLRCRLGVAGKKLAVGYTTKKYAEKLKKVILASS
ncbi:glycosyltransferase family 4 protein [Candidatus Collierbacteria bacterium]|nr:glycosyltransferase family 4 protein [Candidatus Collierbacteria bacterium]